MKLNSLTKVIFNRAVMLSKNLRQKKILIFGGFGGSNVGDDAQLHGSINFLEENFPEYVVTVCSPKIEETLRHHQIGSINNLATRNVFFDFDKDYKPYINFNDPSNKKNLLGKYSDILNQIDNILDGKDNNLNKRQLKLLNEISKSSLVFFSGGGILMGPTASRLWDASLLFQVCKKLNTPVVLSGHNIGIWQNDENKKIAYDGFKNVDIITTRDRIFSESELQKIGLKNNNVFCTHDDALYIKNCENKVRDYILRKVSINLEKPFIALSFHKEDEIIEIVKIIRKITKIQILIIPTCPPDMPVQRKIYDSLKKIEIEDIYIVRKLHHFSEVKSLFGAAHVCVSTRHHPLIFSLSDNVPCISLNLTHYFHLKNLGAMNLFNLDSFSLDCSKNIDQIQFKDKFSLLLDKREQLINTIKINHPALIDSKNQFKNLIKQILNEKAMS